MTTTQNSDACRAVCWGCASAAGVLVLVMAWSALVVLASILVALAAAFLIGLALTRIFCAGSRRAARPVKEAQDVDAAQPGGADPAAPVAAPETGRQTAAQALRTAPATDEVKPDPAAAASDAAVADVAPPTAHVPAVGATRKDETRGTTPARPEALDAAGPGGADDLKEIKGVGPKLEQLCHQLGIYHFSQIAEWSEDEVAWMDANLKGFRGRVSRDDWVAQARILAAGGETEFSRRARDGGVY